MKGFHMYVYYQGAFSRGTRDEWIAKIRQNRQPNKPIRNYTWDFCDD